MFERRHEPLLPTRLFVARLARSMALGGALILFSLAIGTVGYRVTEGLPRLDALYNAAMILTGMGPVDEVNTRAGKLFATCYALFSGIAFLSTIAVVFAPVVHRVMHRFHLQEDTPDIEEEE
jgi:hypothetical protein